MTAPLKIVVATQEDCVAIPQNIARICAMPDMRVQLIAVLEGKGALANKRNHFLRGMGLWQSARMASQMLWRRAVNTVDAGFAHRLLPQKFSIRGVARRHNVAYTKTASPNSVPFLDQLRSLSPDLVVSFSAPCVFGSELLELPRLGCINLHCSLLPKYAGVLPSFWALYHGEEETGATVHFMDAKIDNGDILAQARVSIQQQQTMFGLIQRTKRAGGELMVRAIESLRRGTASLTPNVATQQSYFSWPTIEQMIEFRRRGGRFV